MDLLDRLLEHDRWGTARLLELSRDLTDARLDQEFDIGHRTLRATLLHMVSNTEGWTALMLGRPPDTSAPTLSEGQDRAYAAFADVARRVRDDDRMEDTFTDYFGEQQTFGAAILHVILHNAEHRAEAVHILTRLGVSDEIELDHALWDFVRRGVFSA